MISISKSFGNVAGGYALDSDNGPLKTSVSSLPKLYAKVVFNPSGAALVVERLTWILEIVPEKAPAVLSGRKEICVIICGSE